MPMKKGFRALVDEAMAEIRTLSVDEARALLDDPRVQFVDVRDIRELEREGVIPHALHAPRGMLEFWVDPDSPYHKPAFAQDKTFVFFCAAGWRSALATKTVQDMGLPRVAHIAGGFTAGTAAGAPAAAYEKPTKNA
ncbi:rhodanese-like domain-containing protein [Ralstonia solanacearum]|uniref:rhodanese-like domain-containing protein n=1 Tax=Ralstonia solanacearum TaxID=305 RepID=UPI002029C504|nr:rhodanese-like domain-containing protein [Ralstonia solanacearum]MCL9861140.1 rhodanese-like domain-containing protein [Ralstonia solanacearum]